MHAALLTAAVMLFVVAGVAALTQMRRHPDLHC
jgi:hypothetical protein